MNFRKIIRIIMQDIIPLLFIVAISTIGTLYIIIDDFSIRYQLAFWFPVISLAGMLFNVIVFVIYDIFDKFRNR